jgi:hypothetical protein
MIIENYTLIDFLLQPEKLIEEYIVALRYIKPVKTTCEIFHMKLKHVEMIKENIDSGNDEDLLKIVAKVQKLERSEVVKMKIIEFFGILNSIREQLKVIVAAEENSLTPSQIDFKWEAVQGSERMAKFGIYNTLESLSGGDALKYKKYMNMNYSEIFTVLYMRKTTADLRQEMEQIKSK